MELFFRKMMELAQSHHFKKWGRDISFTSRAAASEGNKNSLWVMKGTIIFSHERLSRSSEEKLPHEWRSHEWGNFFSLRLLSLEWENLIVPWMTNREFFPSPFFKMMGLTFLFTYWKLFNQIGSVPDLAPLYGARRDTELCHLCYKQKGSVPFIYLWKAFTIFA